MKENIFFSGGTQSNLEDTFAPCSAAWETLLYTKGVGSNASKDILKLHLRKKTMELKSSSFTVIKNQLLVFHLPFGAIPKLRNATMGWRGEKDLDSP